LLTELDTKVKALQLSAAKAAPIQRLKRS